MKFVLLPLALLTGCTMAQPQPEVNRAAIWNEGYETGYAAASGSLEELEVMHVSQWALSPCDTSDAWLPQEGVIEDIQFWRAVHRERTLKEECAAKHRALAEQIRAILGVIRD